MSLAYYQLKWGSTDVEKITGITFSDTSETSFTHHMKEAPENVIIVPTSAYHVYMSSAPTSSVIKLTAANASATCEAYVLKSDQKQVY